MESVGDSIRNSCDVFFKMMASLSFQVVFEEGLDKSGLPRSLKEDLMQLDNRVSQKTFLSIVLVRWCPEPKKKSEL